ncbi:hypothetical protein [Sicyoidochytrium minutum DNA virus]|nr:hypothetical protein [Sicyoidochytrium minutum DNA virus]
MKFASAEPNRLAEETEQ